MNNKKPAFNIPAHVSCYDSAGQLVTSQDGGGYLDAPKRAPVTDPEPMRALWAMLPPEGQAILLDYAKQSQRLTCPHLTYDEVPCCSCLVCEAQELAKWREGFEHWHKRNTEACGP